MKFNIIKTSVTGSAYLVRLGAVETMTDTFERNCFLSVAKWILVGENVNLHK